MSQTIPPDPEMGGGQGEPDDRRDLPMTTTNQPLQGESNFGDSSGPFFSIYSKAADEEDNKMVERWQKDADGILIFTGLFSAAVAALLAVTVQDLRPNSQDISAFYLGNIYQVLADPNATLSSTLSPVAKPPPFSAPRYSVWVNTLWFLSLVMSVSCALWATSLHQWARRYVRLAQPARCSPERRARMRAFFAAGVDKMHIPWAVEGLPMLLHLSLFLFFAGLAIFLFNVDREVFSYVICWIGLFLMVYGMITLLPLIRQDSPYNSPLSGPTWFLIATVTYLIAEILRFIVCFCLYSCDLFCSCRYRIVRIAERVLAPISYSAEYYRRRMLAGVEKAAEEMASKRSSEIDVQILDWTISALGDDDSLKSFFEAIPGFFNSKLVDHQRRFPAELVEKFTGALGGFLGRTWSSNSVDGSEKVRRLDISLNATDRIRETHDPFILHRILYQLVGEELLTVEMGHTIASRITINDQDIPKVVQHIITEILVRVLEQNASWVTLAARLYGLPEHVIALRGDDLSLAVLIRISRQYLRSDYWTWRVLDPLSKLDIRNTLPGLQHEFCTLWNDLVQEARNRGGALYNTPVVILREIRHLYITLHQGTDAAPTAFSASTTYWDDILFEPSSYPCCNLASHRPDSTAPVSHPLLTQPDDSSNALSHPPTDGDNTASRQAEQVNVIIQPTTSEIGATSHGPDISAPTNPAHSSSRPTGVLPTVIVAPALHDVTPSATLPHPLEGTEQQDSDIVAPSEELEILSTASTHALAPIPTFLRNAPLECHDAGVASVSNSSYLAPLSIGSSIPASGPTGSATLPPLRPRGLVNTGNKCFANAVLQLLVNLPPFWSLFRELGDLKAQRGAGLPEISFGGGATPLLNAMLRFFKEFSFGEGSPSTQQRSQPATGGTSRAGEEKKGDNVVDSFEPTYLYDAMREKRQLKPLLDGKQQDAEEFLCLYLDALEEELPTLLTSSSGRQSARPALEPEIEEREVSQPGLTEVRSQGFVANSVDSPITRIFGGKFCPHDRTSNKPDVTTQDWRSLHLDIQHDWICTVQDALARISQPQSGEQVSASGLRNASEQVFIQSLPPVLVLHLNRFRYDAAAGGITKIGKSIQLAPELEIPLDIMVPTSQRPSEPPHYKLYGVLYHHGKSAGSGHYTVDVLHRNGDGDSGEVWLHIDDEVVSRMGHEDVFREHGTGRAADETCAYLLFYCRTS